LETLLGGLIGSIITVVLTKILDLIQKSKEHKYSLQRAFFDKKLQAAEAAVSHLSMLTSAIGEFIVLHGQEYDTGQEVPYEVYKVMTESASGSWEKIREASNGLTNSLSLYFDVNEPFFWEQDHPKKLLSYLSTFQSSITQKHFLMDVEEKLEGTQFEGYFREHIATLDNKTNESGKEFVSLIKEVNKEICDVIKKIRAEMKKYDS
jgi:hypothetical protein